MNKRFLMTALASAVVLAGCGGGGDGGSAGGGTTTPPSATSSTTIAGTAATGAAIAGATVQAKCATGSGSATTGVDGRFSLKIDSAVRPCVLSVSAPGGTTLHSVVEGGSGADVVANITPLTELITASIAGGNTASFFSTFDAAAQAKLTQAGLSGAQQSVALALSGVVDLAGIDALKDPLVAANGGNAGNALDQKLDALGATLAAAQTTLAELSSAMAANPDGTGPVAILLQPSHPSCAGLRTGTYRNIDVAGGHSELLNIDAAALTVTFPSDGAVDTLTADGSCQFTAGAGGSEPGTVLFNKSGVAIVRDGPAGSPATAEVIIPEQTLALGELAGTWNGLGYESDGAADPYKAAAITFTFDAAGKGSAGADCEPMNAAACTPWPEQLTATANPQGGFDFTDAAGTVRAFAFKSADGKLSLFINAPGHFFVASKQEAAPLQVVGNTRKWWDMLLNDAGGAGAVTDGEMEVLTVDAVDKFYTRRRPNGDVETMRFDNPRPGMSYRAANTTIQADGSTKTHPGIVALAVPGTGLSVVANLTTAPGFVYSFSLNKP